MHDKGRRFPMPENNLKLLEDQKMLYWKNNKANMTYEEAKETAEEIKKLLETNDIEYFLVDNRNLKGVWTTEVSNVWMKLMNNIPKHVKKTATFCDNIINKLQLDFLSKKCGQHDRIKAFTSDEQEELLNHLDIENFDFLN
jgi:hypothetical protein